MEPHARVLERHSLIIEGTEIAALVPTSAWQNTIGAEEIALPDHVLIPGLVNAHTHAAMALFRGLADDQPLMAWLQNHIWPTEARVVGREFVREGTRLAAAEMLLGGTTCFNDMYFFGDEGAAAAIETGIRAVIGMIVIDFPSAWATTLEDYFRQGQAIHDRYRGHPLISTAFAPHAPYSVNDKALARCSTLAEEMDVPIHIHLHETAEEVRNAVAVGGVSPLQRLESLGLLTPRLLAVHMTALNDDELSLVARNGVNVVHCPESNLKLASGFCRVKGLMDAGANVALGTDGAASNNDLDMLGELRTASLLAKGVAQDPCAVPAATALRMATLNGARALMQEDRIGSLEVGKLADVVAISMDHLGSLPLFDPISQLVYATQRHQVTNVWVGGRRVVEAGQLTTLDVPGLKTAAHQWRERIAQG